MSEPGKTKDDFNSAPGPKMQDLPNPAVGKGGRANLATKVTGPV